MLSNETNARFLRFNQLLRLLAAMLMVAQLAQAACARDPWHINQPATPPPQAPLSSASNPYGMVPAFNPDFWKGALANRVPAGTVLSGILEDDLSSSSSKAGDIFSVKLQDGFILNGREVIPRNSKIIGRVVSVAAARTLKYGNAGQLQVSLQSLVTPDGRNVPFCGFISQNPNHLPKEEPIKRNAGPNIADYGQSVGSFLGSFTSGIGVVLKKRHQGNDFRVDKGEVLPIRLNRSLDMPSPARSSAPLVPGIAPGAPPPSVPAASLAGQQAPIAGSQPSIPGLVGTDPDHPVTSGVQTGSTPAEDANAIFKQPIRPRPLADMPDPF